MFEATPVKVALAWYVVPSILYSTPDCVVKTIVPVVVAHVGWTVTLAVGEESVQPSLSKILAVADLLPIYNINVSGNSMTASSIVSTVMEKELTPPGTVIVPSPLLITPFVKVNRLV